MIEHSVMSRIIYFSKIVLELKLNKMQLIGAREISNRINVRLTSREYYALMITEIDNRQREINNQIKNLMKPLFQNKNFGYIECGQWALSQKEMQKGFLKLQDMTNPETNYILFLSDYKDKVYDILEGSLVLESTVIPILSNQKDVFGNCQNIDKYLNNLLLIRRI
jgi:Zn-dependent M16 (insulinase) family peptidase